MSRGLVDYILDAEFRGGPLNGQRFCVERHVQEYVCWERHVDAAIALRVGNGDPSEPVRAWVHRYRRSPDRLRDGAAEFLYVGVEGTA